MVKVDGRKEDSRIKNYRKFADEFPKIWSGCAILFLSSPNIQARPPILNRAAVGDELGGWLGVKGFLGSSGLLDRKCRGISFYTGPQLGV